MYSLWNHTNNTIFSRIRFITHGVESCERYYARHGTRCDANMLFIALGTYSAFLGYHISACYMWDHPTHFVWITHVVIPGVGAAMIIRLTNAMNTRTCIGLLVLWAVAAWCHKSGCCMLEPMDSGLNTPGSRLWHPFLCNKDQVPCRPARLSPRNSELASTLLIAFHTNSVVFPFLLLFMKWAASTAKALWVGCIDC